MPSSCGVELVEPPAQAPRARLARRAQLEPRAIGPGMRAERLEDRVRRAQLLARVRPAARAAQPLAVDEPGAGAVEREAIADHLQGRLEVRRGVVAIGEHAAHPLERAARPIAAARSRPPGEHLGRRVRRSPAGPPEPQPRRDPPRRSGARADATRPSRRAARPRDARGPRPGARVPARADRAPTPRATPAAPRHRSGPRPRTQRRPACVLAAPDRLDDRERHRRVPARCAPGRS